MNLSEYDFSFPQELISTAPASPRDSARLAVLERATGEIFWDRFLNLPKYLPAGAVLVFNETKVIPARLEVFKETGGRLNILWIETKNGLVKVLADKKIEVGTRLYQKARRSQKILKLVQDGSLFTVMRQEKNFFFLKPKFPLKNLPAIFARFGKTPLPPYIKHSPLSERELKQKYQSIFARHAGSVAAPTASLHFTKRLFKKLRAAGIETHFLTLHVNLGTFAPLTAENLTSGRLHKEFFEISPNTAEALKKAKKAGRPIIAVGTTVCRALESAGAERLRAGAPVANQDGNPRLTRLTGSTDLFIKPGYRFRFIDGLITNFHVPRSSLMMLAAAFLEEGALGDGREKLIELYAKAIAKKFRLFSFGDGMLII